ncbi:MAG TPA: carboxylating nicotinate-nucleotide diphosphorylase [Dehalococcoidia bacterium]|nr:carboxylating nicotinate-nucleotide diphosphorylase [Dehalococcoidia bacterium]
MEGTLPALPPNVVDELVLRALEEDGAYDDITTRLLVIGEQWGRGVFVAKDDGVVCGLPVAAAAMTALDDEVSFDTLVEEGQRVSPGAELAEVEGPLATILAAERVALNFLQRMSGVATATRRFVEAVQGTKAAILDTRKTTPGLRVLERYAVRCGGGRNHRYNLSTAILIKDNHIAAAKQRGFGDVEEIVLLAKRGAPHTMRIEVEVTNMEDLRDALKAGADVILLDNMDVAQIREAVAIVGGRALVEASGGVTIDSVRAIAEAGVDYISVGRLTHSAPAMDISLEVGLG